MFQSAIKIASGFTWPLLISARHLDNTCSCSIGTLTIVNDKGWFITANHMIEEIDRIKVQIEQVKQHLADRKGIESDTTISRKDRQRKLAALGRPNPRAADRTNVWAGRDGIGITNVGAEPVLDLAWGKLEPFDATWIPVYPTFKNPSVNYVPGASLCKLGFPFHEIKPTYDESADLFSFPAGALPCPLFPMDGMFARPMTLAGHTASSPKMQIETSTPGLRGQSGGPVFDIKGQIWAMQTQTAHYDLGFDPIVPGRGGTERQFLNVGRGVHAASLLSALSAAAIDVKISTD